MPTVGGIPYSGPNGTNEGGRAFVFTTGTINESPNSSANDTWVGGRSDPFAGTDITRAHLEMSNTIGPKAASGLNINGGDFRFITGLSTGNGTPGTFNWYCGAVGSSGTQVNGGGGSPLYCMTLALAGFNVGVNTTITGNLTVTGTCTGCGSGGGDTITTPNSTLNVGGTSTNTTLDVNLANAHTWTALQTFGLHISIGGVTPSGVSGTGNLLFGTAPAISGGALSGTFTGSPTFSGNP